MRMKRSVSGKGLAEFVADETLQALLLSAPRDASGLTLTAASHVVIVEPQPDVAVEQQMVGRVHRIGQTRQTHVHTASSSPAASSPSSPPSDCEAPAACG